MRGPGGQQAKNPGRRMVDRAWWNQDPKIEALALTAEQRGKLDTLAQSYIAGLQADTTRRDAYQAIADALAEGDLDAARGQTGRLADAAAKIARAQAELLIDGVAVLNAKQRGILADKWPGMLKRPWIGAGGGGRMARPQGVAGQMQPRKLEPRKQ